MPHDTTATLLICPPQGLVTSLLPTHILLLVENFRPVWHIRSVEASPIVQARRVATLDSPLVDGLLAWLAAAAPTLLAQDPELDRYVAAGPDVLRELATTDERCVDPERVYRACAGLVTVLAAIWPGSVLRSGELDRAAASGLEIVEAVSNATRWESR